MTTNRIIHTGLSSLGLLLICLAARADVRLPQLIGSGMVLQRDRPLTIWGWAETGESVTVSLGTQTYQTTTGTNRTWTLTLPAQKAGGPHIMTIQGHNQLTLTDILFGDVWICSGQSNMELPMSRVIDRYAAVIAQANYPQIRQFNVPVRYDFTKSQVDFPAVNWVAATPVTVLQFTAAGFFFAKNLYEKYHVPIGLLKISVGGSPAEAWLSAGALRAFPAHLAVAEKMKDSAYVNQLRRAEEAVSRTWYGRIWQQDKGLQGAVRWYEPAYDATAWPHMTVPGYWADQGLTNVNGVVWFRKEIDLTPVMAGQPARLRLGSIVDRDSVYLNGVFVGTTGYQYPPRKYPIPAGLLRTGKNTLVVRVINNTGLGGFYFDKPYQLEGRQDTIDLKGPWAYQLGVQTEPLPPSTFFQYQPGGLFNGMVAPLLNCVVKGVIWYQGESNIDHPQEYEQLFPALIADWRAYLQQPKLPFLYVQLANYQATNSQPTESNWVILRDAQRRTLSVPNTGMAVAIDLGEWNDIHPLNKADVGKRLALAAQRVAYADKRVVASGPVFESMQVKGNKLVLTFRETGGGLVSKNGGPLRYFAIAGATVGGASQGRPFVWANATIRGNKIIVWSDDVLHPVAVRYAWADNPEGANLYNREGLPASPFEAVKR